MLNYIKLEDKKVQKEKFAELNVYLLMGFNDDEVIMMRHNIQFKSEVYFKKSDIVFTYSDMMMLVTLRQGSRGV